MHKPEFSRVFVDQLGLALESLPDEPAVRNVLCINPRSGIIPKSFREKRKTDLVIDSFVSDSQWLASARLFSRTVVHGQSHHPLKRSLPANHYDLVLVCEDFSQVDDCDRMAQTYYELLGKSGRLVGGVWNLSYHKSLNALINQQPMDESLAEDPLHGTHSIPIDTLVSRLEGIGFARVVPRPLDDEKPPANIASYVQISKRFDDPMDLGHFLARMYVVIAEK